MMQTSFRCFITITTSGGARKMQLGIHFANLVFTSPKWSLFNQNRDYFALFWQNHWYSHEYQGRPLAPPLITTLTIAKNILSIKQKSHTNAKI
jgi:hypothetical protein